MENHRIKLEVFEGPLDLLLYLVKKSEVEITDIPIEQIADQYLEYLEMMKMLDLDIAGDFLVMAAQLLYIKSKMLLPPEERAYDEDEEGLDPRSELIRQLIEYKKFKEAALDFREMEAKRQLYFPREVSTEKSEEEKTLNLGDMSIFDLLSAFSDILHKLEIRDNLLNLFKGEVSVDVCIEHILTFLGQEEKIRLIELFQKAQSRMEIVALFLATLELVRQRKIRVAQESKYGEIFIHRRENQLA